jgi:hypothetical protein
MMSTHEERAAHLVWTTNKPTVAGWYWFQGAYYTERIVEVKYDVHAGGMIWVDCHSTRGWIDRPGRAARWAGPLSPPKELINSDIKLEGVPTPALTLDQIEEWLKAEMVDAKNKAGWYGVAKLEALLAQVQAWKEGK